MNGFAQILARQLSIRSIRGRLALLLALAFLPAGAIAFQSGVAAYEGRQEAAVQSYGAGALRRLNGARDQAAALTESVRTQAASADFFAVNRGACRATLSQLASDLDDAVTFLVLNDDGAVRCANRPGLVGHPTRSGALIARALRIDDVAMGFDPTPLIGAEPMLRVVARADTGPPRLFVSMIYPVRLLLQRARGADVSASSYVALADRSATILARLGEAPSDTRQSAIDDLANATGAFRIGDLWAVALPLNDDRALFLVEAFPAPALRGNALLAAWWALLGPILLWAAAVTATWFVVEIYVAGPLLIVENVARAYARGEDREEDTALLKTAPTEISSLRRTLAAMAKTLRGREARLAAALQEERALLLEVNHRVKNNLQMVASILAIQTRAATDPAEIRALAHAQERIHLLALAHGRIYASGAVREIPLDQLGTDIVRALHSARGAEIADVRLDLDLKPVSAPTDRAVPFAFLLGESISALLDAGGSIQVIHVRLAPLDVRGLQLEVWATSPEAQPERSSISERLIGAFARQLGATISYDVERPSYVRIVVQQPATTPAAALATTAH